MKRRRQINVYTISVQTSLNFDNLTKMKISQVFILFSLFAATLAVSYQVPFTADAYVYSNSPNSNYGGSGIILVGREWLGMFQPTNNYYVGLVKVSTALCPTGLSLTNATINLPQACSQMTSGTCGAKHVINKTSSTWDESTVTWNNFPTTLSTINSNASVCNNGGITYDLTAPIQAAIANSEAYFSVSFGLPAGSTGKVNGYNSKDLCPSIGMVGPYYAVTCN